MPSSWMYSQTKQVCYQSLVTFQQNCDSIFRSYRMSFINDRLSSVFNEIKSGNHLIEQNASSQTTILLKAETDKTFDKYDFINETKAEKPESVMLGEPLMVNPCSYESRIRVLISYKSVWL